MLGCSCLLPYPLSLWQLIHTHCTAGRGGGPGERERSWEREGGGRKEREDGVRREEGREGGAREEGGREE